jgi:uncharacterized protein YggE
MRRKIMGYKRGPVLTAFSQQEVIAGANGMDGISALGVAGRALPADILSVSYPVTDTIGEAGTNTASDQARIRRALETAGLKVLEVSQRFLSLDEPERPGYFSSGSSSPPAKASTNFQSRMTLRIAGFKNFGGVLRILEQNGARKISSVLLASSKFAGVREELEKEAIEKAISQAQAWARAAGVTAGGVTGLAIAFTRVPAVEPALALYSPPLPVSQEWAPDQDLLAPEQEGEPPLIRYSLTASIFLAITRE